MYVNYEQDDQVNLLPAVQFSYNTAISEPLGTLPFFTNYGYNTELRQGPLGDNPKAYVQATRLKELHEQLQQNLEEVRQQINRYYDNNRIKGPILKEGDKVFLSTKFLKTKRLTKKLDFKRIGPFKIAKKIGTSNYKLSLLNTIRIRSKVFYISLLELVPENVPIDDNAEAEDEEENEFEVEKILDSEEYIDDRGKL